MNVKSEIEASISGTPQHRLLYMDGWRGIAIAGVLVDHFGFSRVLNLGRYGVEMFFVLSGFLMSEILFKKQTPLTTYFPRRFSRTFPALFVFVAAVSIFAGVTNRFQIGTAAVISALTTTYNYYSIYGHRVGVFDNIWSLCIEEHAYIVLALVALGQRRLRLSPILCISTMLIFCVSNGIFRTFVLHQDYYDVYWRSDVRGASILIGCVVSLLAWRPSGQTAGAVATIAVMGVSLLLNLSFVPDPVKYSIGTLAIAIGLTMIPYPPGNVVARCLSSRCVVAVGLVSYSLYLWQQPFAQTPARAERVMLLPLVVVASVISYFLVERPARSALNAWFTSANRHADSVGVAVPAESDAR